MNAYYLKPTDTTPLVQFDPSKNELKFVGRSIPEDSIGFYEPILKWLAELAINPPSKMTISFDLEYFNTSSSKCLLDVFRRLHDIQQSFRCEMELLWTYEDDNEDMLEIGEEYSSLFTCPFHFIAKPVN